MKKRIATSFALLTLVAATLLIYGQTARFDFVRADDQFYVTDNAQVRQGFTSENLRWAFDNVATANWHPLTWYSHMLDVELFGMRAGGHHATSVVLHTANSLILFWLMLAMTHRAGPSAFVAFVFAVHPLHVESVAWISERKDVLSTFFWLLSSIAYLDWGRRGRTTSYAASVILLALGLASKPMVVTLPFVFLLFDYWPLRRWPAASAPAGTRAAGAPRLLLEKAPMFALAAASCVLTLVYQGAGQALYRNTELALADRIDNAVVSYVRYIAKTLWPSDLHLFYQHPAIEGGSWSTAAVLGSGVLLAAITVAVLAARRHRYLAVGWLFYVGTLVPVIGLVQVGTQAIADRYMYVPMIGLLLMVGLGVPDLLDSTIRPRRALQRAVAALAIAAVVLLGALAHRQTGHWRDTEALYSHAIAVADEPEFLDQLHVMRGSIFVEQDRLDEAVADFREAIRLRPDHAKSYLLLAEALARMGDVNGAIEALEAGVGAAPDDAVLATRLGLARLSLGESAEAALLFEQSAQIAPEFAPARLGLARALAADGRTDEAIAALQALIEDRPELAEAYRQLVSLHLQRDEFGEAEAVGRRLRDLDRGSGR